MREYVVVIPARIGSTRLGRKPLMDIHGKPMILHTFERALEAASPLDVYIATDSQDIADVCNAAGAQVLMTSSNCLTGTDRVAEFAKSIPAKTYINLQGDEPLMASANIRAVIDASRQDPNAIINGWAWICEEAEFRSHTVPKVVIRQDGRLLYMSRAPIPGTKTNDFHFSRKQICVYGFPASALDAFAACTKKTAHEAVEDIEILRFLELGWEVRMIELDGQSIAVDTPNDLELVRSLMLPSSARM